MLKNIFFVVLNGQIWHENASKCIKVQHEHTAKVFYQKFEKNSKICEKNCHLLILDSSVPILMLEII